MPCERDREHDASRRVEQDATNLASVGDALLDLYRRSEDDAEEREERNDEESEAEHGDIVWATKDVLRVDEAECTRCG